MNAQPIRRPSSRQSGIALLEAMLAVVILAIGLLGTVGMQARAYSALSDAGTRAEATIATEKLLGVMNNDTANLGAYAWDGTGTAPTALGAWVTETQQHIPGAQITVVLTGEASREQVDITIQWTRKSASAGGPTPVPNKHHVTAYIAD